MQKINQQIQACLDKTKKQKESNENQSTYAQMIGDLLKEIQVLINHYNDIASHQLAAFRQKGELIHCLTQLVDDLEVSLNMEPEALKKTRFYETIDEDIAQIDDWIEEINECIAPEHNFNYIESWDIGYFF